MPRLDGTGPDGKERKTGCQKGRCRCRCNEEKENLMTKKEELEKELEEIDKKLKEN